jgi:hypothetical protein
MKKIILLLISCCFLACASSKTIRESKKTIKGNWTISNITYSKTGSYNVTLFDDASRECFEGSTWKFVPNNNTGTYTINTVGCDLGEREFIFTIQEMNTVTGLYDFLLKPLDENGENPNNVGYRMDLKELSDNSMLWQQRILVDGSPFLININFQKL